MEGRHGEVGRSKGRLVMRRIEHETWLNAKTGEVFIAPAKRVPTSDRCSVARESGEPSKMRKQKTASAGALRDGNVRRLQTRIAKAVHLELLAVSQPGLPTRVSLWNA